MTWRCEICGGKFEGRVVRHTVSCMVMFAVELVRLRAKYGRLQSKALPEAQQCSAFFSYVGDIRRKSRLGRFAEQEG